MLGDVRSLLLWLELSKQTRRLSTPDGSRPSHGSVP
jgi:hypothetical protein